MSIRSITARLSQQTGEQFESWVDAQHVVAGQLGILAHVEHNQAKTKMVHGRLIYEKAGVADFTGILNDGRYYAAEAKSTAKDRLARSEITSKQQQHLETVSRAGGLALLLVEFRQLGARYAIRWRVVPWKTLRTADSLGVEDLHPEWMVGAQECFLAAHHPGSNERYVVGEARKRVYPRE